MECVEMQNLAKFTDELNMLIQSELTRLESKKQSSNTQIYIYCIWQKLRRICNLCSCQE